MADRYWVGGTANWDAATTTNWSATSGGGGGASVPTSSDNVIFDSLSNATAYTCTVTATANCLDLTIGNPLVGVITFAGSSPLNVAGNFAWATGMTRTYTAAINFTATSGTKTITSNGVSFSNNVTFNGVGGTFQLADNFTNIRSGAGITLTNGTFDANGKTVTLTGTLGTVSGTFTGANAFFNLTRTGAAKTHEMSLAGNIEITNLFTVDFGATVTNRLLIQSNTIGTARTITSASNSFNNLDLKDITGAGAGSWNLAAITGLSGDCGGNSGITFTTAATQTATGTSSFTWSTHGWTSRVPLPQDDVVVNNSFSGGQTVTGDMPRLGKSVTFGCSGSPTANFNITASIFGSLDLTGVGASTSLNTITFEGRSMYTLTTAGINLDRPINLSAPGGTLSLSDSFSLGVATSRTFFLEAGTFDLNNQTFTHFGVVNNSGSVTRVLAFTGGGTWDLTIDSAVTVWNSAGGSNFSTSGTGTIKISGSTTNIRTFAGGGFTYSNLWFTNATGSGQLSITGANTFADFKCTDANTQAIKFTNSTTNTATTWTLTGAASNLITLDTVSGASTFTLAKAGGGQTSLDYLSVTRMTGTPANTWCMGGNSTNGGTNSGLFFQVCPIVVAGGNKNLMLLGVGT